VIGFSWVSLPDFAATINVSGSECHDLLEAGGQRGSQDAISCWTKIGLSGTIRSLNVGSSSYVVQ
jgi:hypothetical protein